MIIADTDVLIDFLRGKEPVAGRVAIELESRSFGTTAVSAFELRSGGRTDRQRAAITVLLEAMTIVPLGSHEAELAANLRIELESRGEGIGMADYLIAGTCLSRKAILLTKNRKHFGRVSGLSLATLELAQRRD